MRSTLLLTSALAIGALAGPLQKRYIVTEVDLEIKTVTVYVTPGQAEPTVAAVPTTFGGRHRHSYHSKPASSAPVPVPSSKAAPEPSVVYTPQPSSAPAPTPTPTPSPVQSSKAPVASVANDGTHKSGEIQATFTSGPDYQAMVLFHHNAARANHGAGPLVWDDDVAATANLAAINCTFEHYIPEGSGQGQNIFAMSGDSFNVSAAITESWYKGEFAAMQGHYGQTSLPMDVFETVGHLTQMVWKETTKVGCVSQNCAGKMRLGKESNYASTTMDKFTVCNYASPGNVDGQYASNVGSPISTSNLGSWLD
ncbi:PR-1-like protein [Lindgomyces ingoldianus]|uniref:PR-1-like protein n=1 Tax=Lindgomyces ingoldianus TaxID=673940 RepID=A0ACB6Q9B1_9PLEO|nr:PR-1-like protein [Lindgomyces ingoldianus]KAF2463619.1 PR-1-like protein [Lindgomyces ingoldianus]